MNFDQAFDLLIDHEKGFQDEYNDRGNWTSGVVGKGELKGTKYGITAMTYPHLDIRNLSLEDAKDIYKRDWWDAMCCDDIDPELAFQMFDGAVNSGRGNAVRWLQRALGVADDGDMGPVTVVTLNKEDPKNVILLYNVERLEFLAKISTFNHNGRGWVRRVCKNIRRVL